MADLPVIQLPLPEEEQPKTLYARITNVNEPPKFDDIRNSNLSREEKVRQIQYRTKAYQDDVDRELHKNYARIGLGGLVSAVGALPIAITKNPVIGSAIGGGVYELGQGIMEGDELPELMQRSGFGAAIGGATGGIVSKAPQATKFVNDLSGGKIGNALKPISDKITNSKLYDALMTDIRAFDPNKQTGYHGSPYDFNKFSNEAIGTGEGAQAHGYGHYAALDKDIADTRYRKGLTGGKNVTYNNAPVEYNRDLYIRLKNEGRETIINEAQAKKQEYIEWLENKGYNENNIPEYGTDEYFNYLKAINGIQKYDDIIYDANNINPKLIDVAEKGQLYKLSVPKDDVMLREGARLDKQPQIVQDAFNQIRQEYLNLEPLADNKTLLNYFGNKIGTVEDIYEREAMKSAIKVLNGGKLSANEWQELNNLNYQDLHKLDAYFTNGEDILKRLQNQFWDKPNKEELAQKILYNKGIKGISYNGGIDGEARVIFNPDDIVIGRKYYNQPNLYQQLTGKQNTGALVDALFNR